MPISNQVVKPHFKSLWNQWVSEQGNQGVWVRVEITLCYQGVMSDETVKSTLLYRQFQMTLIEPLKPTPLIALCDVVTLWCYVIALLLLVVLIQQCGMNATVLTVAIVWRWVLAWLMMYQHAFTHSLQTISTDILPLFVPIASSRQAKVRRCDELAYKRSKLVQYWFYEPRATPFGQRYLLYILYSPTGRTKYPS